eukprot:9321108-Pyramimonas_sp.AAC.1
MPFFAREKKFARTSEFLCLCHSPFPERLNCGVHRAAATCTPAGGRPPTGSAGRPPSAERGRS